MIQDRALAQIRVTCKPPMLLLTVVVVVTLVAGLWPGILATILSTIAAWYLFLPPAQGWELDERELLQLLLFLFICAINVAVASLINALIDRLVLQWTSGTEFARLDVSLTQMCASVTCSGGETGTEDTEAWQSAVEE